jgi:hypothetical protein
MRRLRRKVLRSEQDPDREANSGHRVERSASGGFVAFWQNKAIDEKGHMRKFPTAEAAHAFLTRCDTAEKIVHEV